MNKKKSRKNKKKRDNNHTKSTQSNSNKSNDKYLDNFNLTPPQQSAIKFLSEALSISSQEAHIICNECKWEQSEFPTNLEQAQTMLHWNKKNTKSKSKREQSKYKQQNTNTAKKSNKTDHKHSKNGNVSSNHSPHHSPKKRDKVTNGDSPRFAAGFLPHKRDNKRSYNDRFDKMRHSPQRRPINKDRAHSHNSNSPKRDRHEYVNRERSYVPTHARGRRGAFVSRGRGRGRGNVSTDRSRSNKYTTPTAVNNIPRQNRHLTPTPPPSTSASNNAEERNNDSMYVHETLEQELRREQHTQQHSDIVLQNRPQQISAIKLPKEYEKDIDPRLSRQMFQPSTVPNTVTATVSVSANNNTTENGVSMHSSETKSLQMCADALESNGTAKNKSHASMKASPKNRSHTISPENKSKNSDNTRPQSQPKYIPMTQQSFLSGPNETVSITECKEQSFMFMHTPAQERSPKTINDRNNNNSSPTKSTENILNGNGNESKESELYQILNGALVIGYTHGNVPPHLCMSFDTLLALANHTNGAVLTKTDLMRWYNSESEHRLIYDNREPIFSHQSTQRYFDDYKKRNSVVNGNSNDTVTDSQATKMESSPPNNENLKNERKPTRPPMSAKYTHFNCNAHSHHNNNTIERDINSYTINSKSVPNQKKSLSRRERVIISNKKILNSNAKTFEPTKSRSSSRTKSVKNPNNNSKSSTPVLSLQASKSVTPQIMHIPSANCNSIPHNLQMHNSNGSLNTAPNVNVNLTSAALNPQFQSNVQRLQPNISPSRTQQQTVTIRSDSAQYTPTAPHQTYVIQSALPPNINTQINPQISINTLQRVNSMSLPHQSSNGSLPGLTQNIEFVTQRSNAQSSYDSYAQQRQAVLRAQAQQRQQQMHSMYGAHTQPRNRTQSQQQRHALQTNAAAMQSQQTQYTILKNGSNVGANGMMDNRQMIRAQNLNNLQHIHTQQQFETNTNHLIQNTNHMSLLQ